MAKLLIVDDDPFVTESLKVGLGDRGHQVFAGHNGQEGVELVAELTPDLVIIDMTMPIMDGLEATEQIRQSSDVPIIMLTAETDEEDIINALETGVDEYLSKPFRLNELAARIQALIRRRHWEQNKTEAEVAQLKQNLMAMKDQIAVYVDTKEELAGLSHDVFAYFGLGCRNVSKLFLPKGFDLDQLFKAFYPYSYVVEHKKYGNSSPL